MAATAIDAETGAIRRTHRVLGRHVHRGDRARRRRAAQRRCGLRLQGHLRPLELGADLVVHSLTKYINSHGDTMGGAAIGAAALIERIKTEAMVNVGGAMGSFDAWLIQRGSVTFPLRRRQPSESALALAGWLEQQPHVPGHNAFAARLRVITSAVFLGHDELLIVHVAGDDEPSHRCLEPMRRWGHLRLSGGLEDDGVLQRDLARALAGVPPTS